MNTYYISTQPQYYGECTEEEAAKYAELIAKRASELFPSVRFVVTGDHRRDELEDDDLLADVQQTINDNWVDWIS